MPAPPHSLAQSLTIPERTGSPGTQFPASESLPFGQSAPRSPPAGASVPACPWRCGLALQGPRSPGAWPPVPRHTLTWAGLSHITSGTRRVAQRRSPFIGLLTSRAGFPRLQPAFTQRDESGARGALRILPPPPPLLFFLLLPAFALHLSAPLQAWVPSNKVGG